MIKCLWIIGLLIISNCSFTINTKRSLSFIIIKSNIYWLFVNMLLYLVKLRTFVMFCFIPSSITVFCLFDSLPSVVCIKIPQKNINRKKFVQSIKYVLYILSIDMRCNCPSVPRMQKKRNIKKSFV